MSIAHNNFFPENGEDGEDEEEEASDSEGLNSYAAHEGDYRPISSLSDDDDDVDVESDPNDEMPTRINGQDLGSHLGEFNSFSFQTHLPSNGHCCVENGVSNLSLTSDEDEEEEEEEEEVRIRRLSELAITRAFREDENRRNAPITPENALRIVNAMQRISFPGFPPVWADHVPEDQWMDRLRRLREPTAPRN